MVGRGGARGGNPRLMGVGIPREAGEERAGERETQGEVGAGRKCRNESGESANHNKNFAFSVKTQLP